MQSERRIELSADRDARADFTRGSIFFVGTATVVLRYAGLTILTDPNFLHAGDHVHLGYGLTSKRLTEPAIDIAELPPLDLVLLSHYHGDHFDRIAEERLDKSVPIVTTKHAAAALAKKGFTATHSISNWEAIVVEKGDARLSITSTPGRHGPPLVSAILPAVMGSLLSFEDSDRQRRLQLYVSGDTLVHDAIREIPKRFPAIDLALLHLGGTRVLGILVTMDAKQGLEMMRIIDAKKTIPIHYNDYGVFKSPLEDFQKAVREAGLEERVAYLSHGETYAFTVGGGMQAGPREPAPQPGIRTLPRS
jgi:L-ascorbate metabolism protein UlaG (beta-lactamase superfamily)